MKQSSNNLGGEGKIGKEREGCRILPFVTIETKKKVSDEEETSCLNLYIFSFVFFDSAPTSVGIHYVKLLLPFSLLVSNFALILIHVDTNRNWHKHWLFFYR